MAKKVNENITEENGYNMTDIKVPRAANGEETYMFVSVNGIQYQVPKGKTSRVPDFIAKEIERAIAAQEALDETMRNMISA